MSIKVMSRVWDYSQAKGTPLLVLLSLADFADDDGECWPSISTIARKCRLADERHVKRVIHDELEERLGEVVVIANQGKSSSKGGLRSNRYRIVVHMPEESPIVVQGPLSAANDSGSGTTLIVAEGPPLIVVQGPPEPSVEPLLNQPLNPQIASGDRRVHLRRGMRGTGTSPREKRDAQQHAQKAADAEAEANRLVTGIVDTYGHLSEHIVLDKIDAAFPNDPDRHAAAVARYRERVSA